MQDAKIQIKTIIVVGGQVFSSTGEGSNIFECADTSRQGAVKAWIKAHFDEARKNCRSDADAILETAAQLDISEITVRRYAKGY